MKYHRLLALGVLAGFVFQSSFGQTARTQDDTIRISTSAVQIEAIVTDKSGRVVRGLKAADFRLTDEGSNQTLDYFATIDNARVVVEPIGGATASTTQPAGGAGTDSKADASKASPLSVPYAGRFVALVVDDLGLTLENVQRSRNALRDYVTNKTAANDLFSMLSTSGSMGSLQQFTADRQRLLSAINRINPQKDALENLKDPRFNMSPAEAVRIDAGDVLVLDTVLRRIRIEQSNSGQLAGNETFSPSPGKGAPNDPLVPGQNRDDTVAIQVKAAAKSIAAQIGVINRNKLQLLGNVFRSMAELPGRKIVVLLTEQFVTGGGGSDDISTELLNLGEVARRNGVSVYALDAGGLKAGSAQASERLTASGYQLRTQMSGAFSDFENLGAARALVAATGGSLIANTNDIAGGIDRALVDSSAYYVVGFRPQVLDNKFHRLTVTIKDRPDLQVRTRKGYLAVNEETARGTGVDMVAVLTSPVPKLDLPLQVVTNVVPKAGEQVTLVGISVGRNYLTLPEVDAKDQVAAYEIGAWVFAYGVEKPVGVIQHTMKFDFATDPGARSKLQREGLVFVPAQPMTFPPGIYQIRTVAREKSTGSLGSAYQFFEVPDAKNPKIVSLSSALLTPGEQVTFSGQNRFKAGSQMDLRFVIYNLPKDTSGVVQRVRLTDDRGNVLMDSPLPLAVAAPGSPQDQSVQGTRFIAPPARGRYAVVITLQGGKGKIDLERRADFIVE